MKKLQLMFLALLTCLTLQACDDDSPFEELGENIDEGVENTGDALEDAADELDEEF